LAKLLETARRRTALLRKWLNHLEQA
jgi:hypothetical protein